MATASVVGVVGYLINPFLLNVAGLTIGLVALILLDMFYTMHNVPYAALTVEMTDDYRERSRINIYRFGFSLIGSLIATIIFALLTDGAEDPQSAYFTAAWIVMLIIFVTGFAPVPFSPEHNRKRWQNIIERSKQLLRTRFGKVVVTAGISVQTAESRPSIHYNACTWRKAMRKVQVEDFKITLRANI